MRQINSNSSKPVTAALVVLLASVALAACGGSSKSSSTGTVTSAAATSPAKGATGPGAGRFLALRECLRKNGITPKSIPGKGAPPSGGPGATPPKGFSRAQYEAAAKKCGGLARGGLGGFTRINSPKFKEALMKFAACMRENGVNVPAPNTSGKGPIFDTKGLNAGSPQFRAAQAKCGAQLRGAFRSSG